MTQRRWFWPAYVVAIVALSFAVAWSIFQIIKLQERADAAEQAVEVLTDRAPRVPDTLTFLIDNDLILHCFAAEELGNAWLCQRGDP